MSRITLPGVFAPTPSCRTHPGWASALDFSGTSVLIVVGVALDTLQQVESHLLMRHYEGFVKKGRIRGRSRM
jgi:preprotein translocase subunit SecY